MSVRCFHVLSKQQKEDSSTAPAAHRILLRGRFFVQNDGALGRSIVPECALWAATGKCLASGRLFKVCTPKISEDVKPEPG